MDWQYIDAETEEQFCRVEYFALKKLQEGREIEFLVTMREYLHPPDPTMKFFAQSDKQTNQKHAAYTPSGWGPDRHTALWECVRAIRKFPYEPQ